MNAANTPYPNYVKQREELLATNYFGLACFIFLLYDHIITFDDEVRYIWRPNKKIVVWFFLINRYVTPLGFGVNINAYTSSVWTPATCAHFVRYEGAMTYFGVAIASLMMGIRVTAIYRGNRLVFGLMAVLFLGMTGINAWLLTTAGPVVHPDINGCSMLFGQDRNIGSWASATAWTPLIYDSVVALLVVLRTRHLVRAKIGGQSRVITTLVKDGLLYYSVILAANLVLAVMIVKAPDGIKNICAQFQLLITVTMMSRITLNLRKNMERPEFDPAYHSGADGTWHTVPDPPFKGAIVQIRELKMPRKALRKGTWDWRGSGFGSVYEV